MHVVFHHGESRHEYWKTTSNKSIKNNENNGILRPSKFVPLHELPRDDSGYTPAYFTVIDIPVVWNQFLLKASAGRKIKAFYYWAYISKDDSWCLSLGWLSKKTRCLSVGWLQIPMDVCALFNCGLWLSGLGCCDRRVTSSNPRVDSNFIVAQGPNVLLVTLGTVRPCFLKKYITLDKM